jgi:ribosomal protein L12E/L44/L45/RPP1/RPP2
MRAPKNKGVLITEDSMKYANKQASDLNDERIRAVLKALEGFSISEIQKKSRDSSKSNPSKNKLNGLYREAFLKVLSLRESKTA